MLVGLMSDTHCRLPAIRELIAYMQARGVNMVLHAPGAVLGAAWVEA